MENRSYELFKEIMDSSGMKFHNRMKSHSFSYNIFSMNLKELNEGLKLIETPQVGLKLMSEENREAGHQAHREINRLFHNFIASAKTLIEHTRIFVDKHYKDTPLHQAYAQKIKSEYAEDELCRFIQDLRNYMLHQGLPHSQMSISFTRGEPDFESTISLETEKLISWSRWSAFSKSFLAKQSKNIKLSDLVTPYGEKINSLYEWLDAKFLKHHSGDLKALEKLQIEYQSLEQEKSNKSSQHDASGAGASA
ncbi:hypothetical protein [Oceanisphaera sediminis]